VVAPVSSDANSSEASNNLVGGNDMVRKRIDLTGKRNERILITEYAYTKKSRPYWKYICDCGNTSVIRSSHFKDTKSCGCIVKENMRKLAKKRIGTHLSEETKKKISESEKGKFVSKETRELISKSKKGKMVGSKHHMYGRTGEQNPNFKDNSPTWKGDKASYFVKHTWINKHYPKKGKCYFCGQKRFTHYANISGKYKRDIKDFVELCVSCHKKFDGKKIRNECVIIGDINE
jgi:hypothetical protein